MALLLGDHAVSIYLEPPKIDSVEFLFERLGGVLEHHQVKLQAPRGRWTLGRLETERILSAVRALPEGHEFVFASTSPVETEVSELAKRSLTASSYSEFDAQLGEGVHRSTFAAIGRFWPDLTAEQCWTTIRRFRSTVFGEEEIDELTHAWLLPIVEGDPVVAADLLASIALEHVNERLTSGRLWGLLEALGVSRRRWAGDPSARASADRQRARFLDDARASRIAGQQYDRIERTSLADGLLSPDGPRVVILVGQAGMGKSVALGQATEEMASRGTLVVPLRLDRFGPTRSSADLGRQMGLPGSPGALTVALAAGDRAVLVLDQLDAVSQVSGRHPELFDAVDEILSEVKPHANVRVLIACRGFDLEADPRLRRLRSEQETLVVTLDGLSSETVETVLVSLGWVPADLTAAQREILSVPLHLFLLAEGLGRHRQAFGSELDLYEAFWVAKESVVRARTGRSSDWTDVIARLCAVMSERESLTAPEVTVIDSAATVELLLSEHVLVRSEWSLRFFHEAFFDFAFAKGFAASRAALTDFVLSTDQGLFRRSQVRQVLAYRRLADPDRYLGDLTELLSSDEVRFHLKAMTLSWLAAVDAGTDDEWEALRDVAAHADVDVQSHVWTLLGSAPTWFDAANRSGAIEAWLRDSDRAIADRAVWILASIQRRRPRAVASLLSAQPCDGEDWRRRFQFLVVRADLSLDETFVDLVSRWITDGCLDDITTVFASNGSFWDLWHGLSARPVWSARLARAYLERRTELARQAGEEDPFASRFVPEPIDRDLFDASARGDPLAFVENILPFMVTLMTTCREWNAREARWDDRVWRYRFAGEHGGTEDQLLRAMQTALSTLGSTRPEAFDRIAEQMAESGYETQHFLLLEAWAASPQSHAEVAAAFLIDDPRRMSSGYANASYWPARQLIASILPYLSEGTKAALEAAILSFYPAWERSKEGHTAWGSAQHEILSGIADDDLSGAMRSRLAELRRKFHADPEPPRGAEASWLGPAVPRESADKLTDEQWIEAFKTHASDGFSMRRPAHLSGGVHALAGLVREQAIADPKRFADLLLKLPIDVNPAYFEAILEGLGATKLKIDPALAFEACRRCNQLEGRPCGRSMGDAIATHADAGQIPADILDILAWHATQDPDPRAEEASSLGNAGPDGLRLLNVGINTNRGRAILAIAKILRSMDSIPAELQAAIQVAVSDPVPGVRACTAEALLALSLHDRDLAVRLFAELAEGGLEAAASAPGERFIRIAALTHAAEMRTMVGDLLDTGEAYEAQVGGRQACLAAFADDGFAELATRALNGSAMARLGACEVYAANLGDEGCRDACRVALAQLFQDERTEVRREAGTCFRSVRGAALASLAELLKLYAASPAIADNPRDVIDAILEVDGALPPGTDLVCQRVLDLAGAEAGSIASAWSADMPEIATIAVRMLSFGADEDQGRALDLIDTMSATSAYGLRQALDAFERR